MNGTENHVHLLALLTPALSISDQLRDLKAISSTFVHDCFPNLKAFAWQEGYSAFTLSKSVVPDVTRYINGQQEHHKKTSFEDELISLLERAGIEYDPRYVFD